MDVYCPICREPWDMDCFHEQIKEDHPKLKSGKKYDAEYKKLTAKFRSEGCKCIGGTCTVTRKRSVAMGALYDLLGDDMDGAASMMEDHMDQIMMVDAED